MIGARDIKKKGGGVGWNIFKDVPLYGKTDGHRRFQFPLEDSAD